MLHIRFISSVTASVSPAGDQARHRIRRYSVGLPLGRLGLRPEAGEPRRHAAPAPATGCAVLPQPRPGDRAPAAYAAAISTAMPDDRRPGSTRDRHNSTSDTITAHNADCTHPRSAVRRCPAQHVGEAPCSRSAPVQRGYVRRCGSANPDPALHCALAGTRVPSCPPTGAARCRRRARRPPGAIGAIS